MLKDHVSTDLDDLYRFSEFRRFGAELTLEQESSKMLKEYFFSGKVSSVYQVKTDGVRGLCNDIVFFPGLS